MPDQSKPRAGLHSAVPEEVREFVRCRRDSVDIAPELPDFPGFTLSFEAGADGSITILLDGPGEFMDSSISVSIQNGHLVADTSNVKFGRELVDKWIRDFNADLDAPPKKQLSGVSIKNGKLHVTKSPVTAGTETPLDEPPMTPPAPPPRHVVDPIPPPVAVGSPDDPAADGPPPAPPPRHVVDPIPPPVEVATEEVITTSDAIPDLTDIGTEVESDPGLEDADSSTGTEEDFMMLEGGATHPGDGAPSESEPEPESGFIGELPMSDAAKRLRIYRRVGGVVALGVIAFFLFGNRGGDTPVTPPTDQAVETAGDPEPEPAADDQTSEEPALDEEPASSSTGSDPQGDGKNGNSEKVTAEEDVPGADIESVRYERGPAGEHWFIIDVYGDGRTTATDPEQHVGDYLIDVEVRGSDGWGTRVQFNNGVAEPGRVRLGPNGPGREILEGAEVSVEWLDADTMKVTVTGTGTALDVGAFDVDINVFWAGGSFYDHAEGVGGV